MWSAAAGLKKREYGGTEYRGREQRHSRRQSRDCVRCGVVAETLEREREGAREREGERERGKEDYCCAVVGGILFAVPDIFLALVSVETLLQRLFSLSGCSGKIIIELRTTGTAGQTRQGAAIWHH